MFHPSQQDGFVRRIVQELWDFCKIDARDYMNKSCVEILSLDDGWLREMGFWNGQSLPSRDEDVQNTIRNQTWTKEQKRDVLDRYEKLRREGHGSYDATRQIQKQTGRPFGGIRFVVAQMKQADCDDEK